MVDSLADEFDHNRVADLLAANDRGQDRQVREAPAIDRFHHVAQVLARAIGGTVRNDFRDPIALRYALDPHTEPWSDRICSDGQQEHRQSHDIHFSVNQDWRDERFSHS
jgi:hypothetical protein